MALGNYYYRALCIRAKGIVSVSFSSWKNLDISDMMILG